MADKNKGGKVMNKTAKAANKGTKKSNKAKARQYQRENSPGQDGEDF